MAKLENATKDNPKLEQRVLKDGRISLYLEYYLGRKSEPVLDEYGEPVYYENGRMKGKPKYKVTHLRDKETLNLYLIAKPRTPYDRQQNKETLELAENIRREKEQQLKQQTKGYRLEKSKNTTFISLFQSYINDYTKCDVRMLKMALRWFEEFLEVTPEYKRFKDVLKPKQITKEMIVDFTEFLKERGKGETPKSVFQRFKKVVKWAIEHSYMTTDPTKDVRIMTDDQILRKDVLSTEEVVSLINTHYQGENPEIRRAFIFCCYCGLRFCDVKDLTYKNIDYSNRMLKFEQNKTKGHSANSGVVVPLNDGIMSLVGKPEKGHEGDLIFHLPSHTMCLKALKHWTARAGIAKHITWHCGRHSFAVNILNNGANIKTVASLLGHSGLKHTEKYTRAVDELKQKAIDSLPTLEVGAF